MKGRKYRKIELERFMGRQAWSGKELAEKLDISPLNARRYLRRYLFAKRVMRKKFGRIWYYAITRFLSRPNVVYQCPICKGRMDVYQVKCGCEFQLCSMHNEHSVFNYCARHKGTVLRFRRIQATCALCGTSETITYDRKEKKYSEPWQYFGKLEIPGSGKKTDYWECPKCTAMQAQILS